MYHNIISTNANNKQKLWLDIDVSESLICFGGSGSSVYHGIDAHQIKMKMI